MELEDAHPRKKAKVGASKKPTPPRAQESVGAAESGSRARRGLAGRQRLAAGIAMLRAGIHCGGRRGGADMSGATWTCLVAAGRKMARVWTARKIRDGHIFIGRGS